MGRGAVVVAAAAVAAVATLGGCGNGASTGPGANPSGASAKPPAASTTVRTINVKVRGGKATGDTGRIAVATGTPIVLSVSSDVADEIHVHGYDRKANIPAGATAAVTFVANTPGVFEVELENSKLQLLQLQVG
ncbi:MAG TPA: hypothetical protein VFA63_10070 [Pseudonocardiaceae bacterium]|nr:hypothetical protein [Pseudonocardiaceae bacterium]